jgi:hypothetical protein
MAPTKEGYPNCYEKKQDKQDRKRQDKQDSKILFNQI